MSDLQDVIEILKHLGGKHSQSSHAPKSGKTAPKGGGSRGVKMMSDYSVRGDDQRHFTNPRGYKEIPENGRNILDSTHRAQAASEIVSAFNKSHRKGFFNQKSSIEQQSGKLVLKYGGTAVANSDNKKNLTSVRSAISKNPYKK